MTAEGVVNKLLEAEDVDPEQYVSSFEPRYWIYSKVNAFNPTKTYWGGGFGEPPNHTTGRGLWHRSPLDAASFNQEEAKQELEHLIQNYANISMGGRAIAAKQVGMELVDNKFMHHWRKQREYQARRKARRRAWRNRPRH
jgi:hypothetical protein